MKREIFGLVPLFILCFVVSGCTSASTISVTESANRPQRTLRIDGDNLGFPQPYTGSAQGRAYLYMSLIFDTLT